jgi:hypothetical protein
LPDRAGFRGISILYQDLVQHGFPPPLFQRKMPPAMAAFFFFYPKFRIAGWEGKPANFVGVKGSVNQRLLLWVSGGKLTNSRV